MNLPAIGDLRHRVKILISTDIPTDDNGSAKEYHIKDEVWGALDVVGSGIFWGSMQVEETVTHRIYLRSIPGRTRPQDLTGVTYFVVNGMRYRARRTADIGGKDRFTVIDCEQLGVFDADQCQC